jgi:hypothetical protein
VEGNLLCVQHRPDGTTHRLKSNAITGLALSPMNAAFGWADPTKSGDTNRFVRFLVASVIEVVEKGTVLLFARGS